MDPAIEGTAAAAAAEHTEIEGTSAEAEHTEIEATSAEAEHREKNAEHKGSFALLIGRLILDTEYTESSQKITIWPDNSIFRVSEHIRSSTDCNFEPKLVSIGPYYHGRENLKRMEDLKIRCIQEILKMLRIAWTGSRTPRDPRTVTQMPTYICVKIGDEFLRQFMVFEEKARAYYKEKFDHSPENFVKMLFLDSCFIIRTIFAFSQQTQSITFQDVHIKEVRSDILLLDNQIPLFFIKEVYQSFLTVVKDRSNWLERGYLPSLDTVLEQFIRLDMPWTINSVAMMSSEVVAHLLDLYWRCSLPPKMYRALTDIKHPSEQREDCSNMAKTDRSYNPLMVMANATELRQKAGIQFKKFKDKGHLDVSFSNGIMRMPRLKIDSRQITLLRNLIAFESCCIARFRIISCYMKLMDALIDSEEDVKLLQQCGVIYNTLSSHEMAATIFNDIGNFCFIDDDRNPFSGLYEHVQEYYDSNCNRRWASLRHNYCNSPWTCISVVAAIILLILSVLQTFYAIYGYHHRKN